MYSGHLQEEACYAEITKEDIIFESVKYAKRRTWPSKLRTTARTSGTLVRKICSSSGSRSSSAVSSASSFHGFSCAHQGRMMSARHQQ